ncbi:MAG: TVP38/TMEM64 family protein [Anaerolineales bacterium]|nr:TVP38/TMEM64 family protein [Anaerolineales bacterium]
MLIDLERDSESPMLEQEGQPAVEADESFLSRNWPKLAALAIWLLLLGGYAWYYISNDLTPTKAVAEMVGLLQSPYGVLLYILIYALRPIIFFPATVLTVTAGAVFGSGSIYNLALAVLYTIIASNTSATVAYLVGRYFGKGLLKEAAGDNSNVIQRYTDRMRQNSFETILVMRFIFLPYDLVNYLAGFLRINWKPFILATFLGSIPGTIAFVSFGASLTITDLLEGKSPEFNPWVLAFGVVIFVVSLVISRYFKKREAR